MPAQKSIVISLEEIKKNKRCIFCNSQKNPLSFCNQTICSDCLSEIRSLFREGYFSKENFK